MAREIKAEWFVLASVLFATTGQLCIKLGLGHLSTGWTKPVSPAATPITLGIVGGLLIYGLGTLLWVLAVSKRNISYLYPLASLNYIFVALGGHLLLHEPIRPGRWLGILVMTTGIVVLTQVAPEELT